MPDAAGYTVADAPDAEKEPRTSQRDRLIETAITAGIRFWHDADGAAFATVPRDDRIERYAVRSRRFRLLLRSLYGARNPNAKASEAAGAAVPGGVSDTAMAEALPTLEAMALTGELRQPEVRVLRDAARTVWLDLGDATWRAVAVSRDGWRIADKADVPLIRPDGMRALPLPVPSADALGGLRRLLNLGSDADLMLTVACLVAALWPSGPYPVLAIDGEQGSGKSTATKMIRRLVDPNAAELRAMPRGTDDLLIAARNGRVIAADNVSHIEAEMADALCRVATGGGIGKRALYTDGEEHIVNVCRPVLLNGIPSLLARGDLADRSIAITLPPIPDHARRPEADVWTAFDAAAPGILALLLDGLAMTLRNLPTLRLGNLPRMADFTRLACPAAPAFGWTAADMLTAIRGNREAATLAVVESDTVAEAVRSLLAELGFWRGTGTALLAELSQRVMDEVRRDRGWPKDAARIGTRLKRAAPGLRRVGVVVEMTRDGHDRQRLITIRPEDRREMPSAPSAPSAKGERIMSFSDLAADSNADSRRTAPPIYRPQGEVADGADGLRTVGGQHYCPHESPANTGTFEAADSADSNLPYSQGRAWEATL